MSTGRKPISRWARYRFVTLLVVFCSAASQLQAAPKPPDQTLKFNVFLNDREIGTHSVRIQRKDGEITVTVTANFLVKVMRIPVFRYAHKASEIWRDNCLVKVDTVTQNNQEALRIVSEGKPTGLFIQTPTGAQLLSGCVRSYAYWDPSLLEAERLLNTQTGEYQKTRRRYLGVADYTIGREKFKAQHYRLTVADKAIDLWYSKENEWLGLKTMVTGGRKLEYQRQI